ncbi:MAG TPA: YbjN domain-containing protein [Allocoleopsis sp.]
MSSDILPENQVTRETLQRCFKSAFLKTEIDEDGDLRVQSDFGIHPFVMIDEDRKLIKFMSLFSLKENIPEEDKLKLVNKLNDDVILVRFSVNQPDLLVADYYLFYEEGISTYQIIHTFKRFAKITVQAIEEHDTEDLLE